MFLQDVESSRVYDSPGIQHKARCIVPQVALTEKTRFLIGTHSLKDENEIHLIEVQDDDKIKCVNVFAHQHEIWSLSPSPFDASLLFTCHNSVVKGSTQSSASLWKINNKNLNEVCQLKPHLGTVRCVLWDDGPGMNKETVVSLDDHNIRIWKLSGNDSAPVLESHLGVGDNCQLTVGRCNPHFSNQLATATDQSIRGWDLRSNKQAYMIEGAHGGSVRDIDFNKNKPYYLVSGGDDSKVRFWDYRKVDQPVKELAVHSHWVWNVKYNPFHDQLVISSSTDWLVYLYNTISISSSPVFEISHDDDPKTVAKPAKEDHLVKRYEEHEDSVYSIAWSCCETDSWTFASLSYDGRVVINRVPQEEVDKILGLI